MNLKAGDCWKTIRQKCGGVLEFATRADYQTMYDCVEARHEAYLDSFETAHSTLTDDAFSDLADSIGWVDEQILIDFEAYQSFNSYRKKMAAREAVWLAAGADPATSPDNYNVFDDDIEETLRSRDGAIIIDDTLYVTDSLDQEWIVPGASCVELALILNGGGSQEYKRIYVGSDGQLCCDHDKEFGFYYYDNNKKMVKFKLRFNHASYHTKAIAKMKMYRKKSIWHKYRAKIHVKSWGDFGVFSADKCDDLNAYAITKGIKRRRHLRVAYKWDGAFTFKTGNAKGTFTYPDASSPLTHALTFP